MEAVAPVQTVKFGGFWVRLLAWVIDFLIPSWVFGWVFGQSVGDAMDVTVLLSPEGQARFILPLLAFGSAMILHYVLGPVLLGGTVGKILLGYRIVDHEYRLIGPFRAIARYFAWVVSLLPLGAGFLLLAASRDKRGLHDRLVGTFVVRKEFALPSTLDRRRLAATLALLVVMVGAGGVASSVFMGVLGGQLKPAIAIGDAFLSSLRDEDYATAYSYCHPQTQAQVKDAKGLDAELRLRARGLGIASWTITNAVQQSTNASDEPSAASNTAQLEGSLTYTGGRSGAFALGLAQYEGEWRVYEFLYYR